jgi:TIR domain
MSGQIFISYRREESSAWAGRLSDRLSNHFPSNQIFMDVDSVDLGEDFVKTIEKTVGSCDVLIAVIGKGWLSSCDQEGQRRLDNPEDFVRIEIATALKRDIRVIPVLVDGALMPRSRDLSDDLKALVRRNALQLSHDRFRTDSERLASAVERALEKTAVERREREEKERLEKERLAAQQGEKDRVEAEQRERGRLDAERREKEQSEAEARHRKEEERLKAERRETEAMEAEQLDARRREHEKQERLETEQREKERLEAERRQREEQERLEHEPQAQSPTPVAPSAPPAKPEVDKPSAEILKVVYPQPAKPVEPEREKPPPSSSGGTGGKTPSKQVIAFLAIAAVLVVGGLIYLAFKASQSPPPQPAPIAAVTPSSSVIATPTVEEKARPTVEVAVQPSAQPTAPIAVRITSPSISAPPAKEEVALEVQDLKSLRDEAENARAALAPAEADAKRAEELFQKKVISKQELQNKIIMRDQAKASFLKAQAKAELGQAIAEQQKAEHDGQRMAELFNKKIASQQDYDKAVQVNVAAKVKVEAARVALDQREMENARAR